MVHREAGRESVRYVLRGVFDGETSEFPDVLTEMDEVPEEQEETIRSLVR